MPISFNEEKSTHGYIKGYVTMKVQMKKQINSHLEQTKYIFHKKSNSTWQNELCCSSTWKLFSAYNTYQEILIFDFISFTKYDFVPVCLLHLIFVATLLKRKCSFVLYYRLDWANQNTSHTGFRIHQKHVQKAQC